MKSYTSRLLLLIVTLVPVLFIAGCAGNGSGSVSSSTTTSVSGTVAAGPASGAVVIVKSAGIEVARSGISAADGSFTVNIPSSELSKELTFETSGGTFPDEATSTAGIALGTLSAHVPAGTLTAGSNVTIDPSSTIIHKLIAGGSSRSAAETAFSSAFGYTPNLSVKPAFATMSSASSTSQRLVGLRAAAFSQLTKDLGLTPDKQFELIQALSADLSDGVLDGLKPGGSAVTTASGTPIPADIANCFAKAMMTFTTGSSNKSKLTTATIDPPPFAKTAQTSSYLVEYLPGTMAAVAGKTSFKIRLSNRDALHTPATGKTITLMPKMSMPAMSHAAPVDSVVESATPGTYDCSVYYLMASGPGMGIWELKVMVGMESAIFYPPVAMAMGTTNRTTLKGQTDEIGSMTGTSKRRYYLFNDGSTFAMSSTFKLFIAAEDDSMMMKYSAVSNGSTLHNAMGAAWTVFGMTVEASTDNSSSWKALTDDGAGHWSVSGLTGLAMGGTVKVRIIVNGEQKTTDGAAVYVGPIDPNKNNDSATFIIVAGM